MRINIRRVMLYRPNGKWSVAYTNEHSNKLKLMAVTSVSEIALLIAPEQVDKKEEDSISVIYHLKPDQWFTFQIQ